MTNSSLRAFALVLCLSALMPALLYAGGGKEKNSAKQTQTESQAPQVTENVQVTGLVRLTGNEPFTELIIVGSDNVWYVDKDEKNKLKELQYRSVTVEGTETVQELRFANGLSAGLRRTLKDIVIIEIEQD